MYAPGSHKKISTKYLTISGLKTVKGRKVIRKNVVHYQSDLKIKSERILIYLVYLVRR
jgi:hypothetical protein